MEPYLSRDTIVLMTPLLASLSKLICQSSSLTESELRVLLLGVFPSLESEFVQEAKLWAQLLQALHERPSEELRRVTIEALLLRGLAEAPVLLAISQVSTSSEATKENSSLGLLKVSQETLDFGQIPMG